MYEVDLFDVSVSTSWFILIGTNLLFLKDFKVVGSTLGRGAWAAWQDHGEKDEGAQGSWLLAELCLSGPRCHGEENPRQGPRGGAGSPQRGLALLLSSSSGMAVVFHHRNTPSRDTMHGAMWALYLLLFFKSHRIVNIKKLRNVLRKLCKPLHFAATSGSGMSLLAALTNKQRSLWGCQ